MANGFDIVMKNGQVIDGTGNPWFRKDIGISGGKIGKVGRILGNGKETIDAQGMIVSPGFIDLHTHSDLTILAYPSAESYMTQGVTTNVVGNCRLSLVPMNPQNSNLLRAYLSPFLASGFDYGWNWATYKEYYDRVEEQGSSVNLAPLVGQGTIRLAVKGFDSTRASIQEMDEMKKLLEQCLEDGAFGMSTGLIYPPHLAKLYGNAPHTN